MMANVSTDCSSAATGGGSYNGHSSSGGDDFSTIARNDDSLGIISSTTGLIFAKEQRQRNGGSRTSNAGSGGRRSTRNRNQPNAKRSEYSELNSGGRNDTGFSFTFNNSKNGTNNFSSNEWLNITSICGNNKKLDTASVAAALQMNLPEDMRISKLRRRLVGEKNPNVAIELCEKLKLVICDPGNASYVRRSFDNLAESLMAVLKDGPDECNALVAELLGMMGHVMRTEFSMYRAWLVKAYKHATLRIPMMWALQKTLQLDEGKQELRDHAGRLMELLKDYLECADVADVFVAITDAINVFSRTYPKAFEPHFTDIVDIVVGWHLETDQTAALKKYCSATLQGFHRYWAMDAEFTVNLLGQFLEDIAVCGDEIQTNSGRKSPNFERSAPPELCFSSLVGAFNSVLKCSWSSTEALVLTTSQALLFDSYEKITTVAMAAIPICNDCELVVHVNEFLVIMLDCRSYEVDFSVDDLFALVTLQMQHLASYSEEQTLSFLCVVLKIVDTLLASIPLDFVAQLLKPTSTLRPLKFYRSQGIRTALVHIYHHILNIKDVLLLQQAYRNILSDLGIAVQSIAGSTSWKWPVPIATDHPRYSIDQAECTISFYLTALSALATSSSSIIAMWALQPSILELLAHDLRPIDLDVWRNHQAVQYAIITLLAYHCRKNSNFIASSSLLNIESTKISEVFNKLSFESTAASPTTQHFALILKFLRQILTQARGLTDQTLTLLLEWCHHVIGASAQYATILEGQSQFTEIVQNIARISTVIVSTPMKLLCADCLSALDEFETVNAEIQHAIAEICTVHMCSTDGLVRDRYTALLSQLPLDVSLQQVTQFTGLAKDRAAQAAYFQHWYCAHETRGGTMRPQYFKNLMRRLAFNARAEFAEDMLLNAFAHSWYDEEGKAGDFGRMAASDLRCLVSWAQWEAAQHCVNNKLRTALGKPQDTFLRIESIIKEDARILALKEKSVVHNVEALVANQKHARMLLGFMEALEKAIYNASEGTAFSLPLPEKPARTFFHINASTCSEWFNRIRTAVDLVALHCMEPEMVIRYSETVLKNLAAQGKTAEPLFEHTLMSHAWALLRNGESDALHGLYVWTRAVSNRKFVWVKLAAEQAAGHREHALIGYKAILASPDEPKLDRHVRDFIADQLLLCYYFQNQWHEMREFICEEERWATPRVTIPLLSTTVPQLDYLIEFNQDGALCNLADWEVLEKGSDISNDFSYHKVLSLVENTLCLVSFLSSYDDEVVRVCSIVTRNSLQECLRTKSCEHLHHLMILNHLEHVLRKRKLTGKNIDLRSFCVGRNHGSATLMGLLRWTEQLCDKHSETDEQVMMDLRLDLCAISRKEGNLGLCERTLEKFFEKFGFAERLGIEKDISNIQKPLTLALICERIVRPVVTLDPAIWTTNMVRGVYETSKWMYCHADKKEMAIQFAASTVLGICQRINGEIDSSSLLDIREKAARSLLTLSEWVQGEHEKLLVNEESPLTRLVSSLADVRPTHAQSSGCAIIPTVDTAVGKLIKYSIHQCPDLAKAWGALGNWCYRWGRKMVELRMEHDGDQNRASLRSTDIAAIAKLVPDNASEDDISRIVAILNKHQVSPDDEEIGVSENCSTELIEQQLRQVNVLVHLSPDALHGIVDIWKQAHRNVYSYYEMSADAYFKFLHLATSSSASKYDQSEGDCSTVTATLRLLRLIVKHALGLQEVLEEGLACTPTSPWKVIIPQLFSRLNHHEPYVRKRVSELLCRVAQDCPHLIIFPAVVGSNQEQRMDLADISMASADDLDDDDANERSSTGNTNTTTAVDSALTTCFNALLDTLSKQAQETVHHVQLLVRELKRVTLLWDELWLVALAQVYSECARRIATFETDLRKSADVIADDKPTLWAEKHRIMMRPLVFVMERLQEITALRAETNNERQFQEKYAQSIADTIAALRMPFQRDRPSDGWHKFKTFYGQLQVRSQKRSACTLKMVDISPVLAQMRNTAISMPGVDNAGNGDHTTRLINIKSVDPIVHILPTKTKPKKLAFHGSDGRRYTYLFKGLEDLHLDERIMQFLSIANSMMSKATNSNGTLSNYRARHYSVIPLGSRSGLISWVDGVTPIFALYKKWQQREAANPRKDKTAVDTTAKKTTSSTTTTTTTATTRPSEMFQKKLAPLLAEHKLKITDPRKDWPLPVLKKVLADLSAETPRDLLAKELWCYSTNAAAWRQVVRNYSQSIAVMSVIGYVIGLGDRHLDNILIELSSGEVVHIDYNVCFEKGKTLRVPEKVPFRMTPNLEEALGVTGIEGTFRLACEHVLKALKKGRETLLTLLEAFVYDPLVDWAVGEDGAGALAVSVYGGEALGGELRQARKQLDHEVTRDTLAIRFTEIKPEWMRNRDDITLHLTQMQKYLQQLQAQRKEMLAVESHRDLLSKQLAMVHEAETLGSAIGSHPLSSLSQRYVVYKRNKIEHTMTRSALLDKASTCEKHLNEYTDCIRTVAFGRSVHQRLHEVDEVAQVLGIAEFDIVKELLENSAQGAVYVQSDQIRKELDTSYMQQATIGKQAIEAIIQYGDVVGFHPQSYHDNHRLSRYADWCRHLADNQSVVTCREVVAKFHSVLGDSAVKPPLQQIISFSLQLHAHLRDDNFKLQKTCERLQLELDPNDPTVLALSQAYAESKAMIAIFLQEQFDAVRALDCVTVTAVCDLNQRLQMMEAACAAAGDNMLDLTSNGKWFLDELYAITAILLEMVDVLGANDRGGSTDIAFRQATDALRSSHLTYAGQQQMHANFMQTILADTLHGIIFEDVSILDMISAVSSLQDGMPPMQELLATMHLHLRCTAMNVASSHHGSIAEARRLRERLDTMRQDYESEPTSAGNRLFLTFYGLFEDLERKHTAAVQAASVLTMPNEWRKIDQIKDSRDLAAMVLNAASRSIFEDMQLVKRLITMIEVFTLCVQIACAYKGNGNSANVYDDERLLRPLKRYIADHVWHLQLGVASHAAALVVCNLLQSIGVDVTAEIGMVDVGAQHKVAMTELCSKFVDSSIKTGRFSRMALNHASSLCLNLDMAWRKWNTAQQLQTSIYCQTEQIKRTQLLLSAHLWMYEEITAAQPGFNVISPSPINRTAVVLQMRGAVKTLTAWRATIAKMREEIGTYVTAINQRLKWAVGANPSLNNLCAAFREAVAVKRTAYDKADRLADASLVNCRAILQYESLRLPTKEALDSDQIFLNLVSQWEKSCVLAQTCYMAVTPVEEALVELLDPEGPIDRAWCQNVVAIIDEMTDLAQTNIGRVEATIIESQDTLHSCSHKLRTLMAAHHRMASDVRTLLRTTLKVDGVHVAPIKEYLKSYKEFLDTITELHGHVLSKDFTEEVVDGTLQQIARVLAAIDRIFGGLYVFENDFNRAPASPAPLAVVAAAALGAGTPPVTATTEPMAVQDVVSISPLRKNPKGTQTEQKRNAYAVSVWRRIRMKLESRDPDPTRRCTVAEQVDWMIREARNPDNLAVLYEGWTPWV